MPARSRAILQSIALSDKRHTEASGGQKPYFELRISSFGQAANLPDRLGSVISPVTQRNAVRTMEINKAGRAAREPRRARWKGEKQAPQK